MTGDTPESARPRFSILVASRNRPAEVQRCLESVKTRLHHPAEVIVLDDGSDTPMKDGIAKEAVPDNTTWLRNEGPTGVSGARNKLVENASGEILVFIDDDAWLVTDDIFDRIDAAFSEEPELGILAFRIHLNGVDSSEFQLPFTQKALRQNPTLRDTKQHVSYFVGAGHAISRRVFEQCGPYPTEFVYGHEELDLAYRSIGSGFTIAYDPSIAIVHQPASSVVGDSGRSRQELYYLARNRLLLAHRNLPCRYATAYSLSWSLYYLADAMRKRAPLQWLAAMKDGFTSLDGSKRRPLSKNAVDYLRTNHGRLWR